jgi:hypothetical protein
MFHNSHLNNAKHIAATGIIKNNGPVVKKP